MIYLITFLITIAEIIWQRTINFPPTIEQLNTGIKNIFDLWALRTVSLGLLASSVYFVSTLIPANFRKYFYLATALVPVLSLTWMSYPQDALKVFLVTGCVYLLSKTTKKFHFVVIISTLLLIFLNLFTFKQNPAIIENFSFNKAQEEITFRFNIEDTTNPSIDLPLILRRVAYNKYFFVTKKTLEEAVSFFDLETMFFQDVHPMDQKAFPLFFWPGVVLILLTALVIERFDKKTRESVIILLVLSFANFLTTSSTPDRRHLFTIYPIALFFSLGAYHAYISKLKFYRLTFTVLVIIYFYGWATNLFDRTRRPDYWLDNHQIAYNYILMSIKNSNAHFDVAYYPDTLYALKNYCQFYNIDCSNFENKNFELDKFNLSPDTLYIGFTGNFLGINDSNAQKETILNNLNSKGLTVLGTKHIMNNIASGYGQTLIIAIRNK